MRAGSPAFSRRRARLPSLLGLLEAPDRGAFQYTGHLLAGRERRKNAVSRDRNRSRFGRGAERVLPAPRRGLGGGQDPAEHVAGPHGVDGDDPRRRYAKRLVGREEES